MKKFVLGALAVMLLAVGPLAARNRAVIVRGHGHRQAVFVNPFVVSPYSAVVASPVVVAPVVQQVVAPVVVQPVIQPVVQSVAVQPVVVQQVVAPVVTAFPVVSHFVQHQRFFRQAVVVRGHGHRAVVVGGRRR